MRVLLTLLIAPAFFIHSGGSRPPVQTAGTELVELDVAVVDRQNRPVIGLERKDFQIKEDGKVVDVKTFSEVSGAEIDDARQVVLLLDDSSVPMGGTLVIQAMAQAILSRKNPEDDVSVVRLNNDRDEAFGDVQTALSRIDEYRAGVVPFQNRGSAERVLRVIAAVSRTLEAVEHRRKIIACIGGPRVCNVLEPQPRGYSDIWQPWVSAVAATARANVTVFAVMPVPPGTSVMMAAGLPLLTGGDGFSNTVNFDRFVNEMWAQGSQYYLLGYWPSSEKKRELHTIDVKVARKDVRVRARRYRG